MTEAAENPAKAQRRSELLEAAFAEFSEKGYAGASMEAIARRASASKETLYAWFENKERLFDTLFAARVDTLKSRVNAVAEADASPGRVLTALAVNLIRFMLAVRPLTEAMGAGEPGAKALRLVGRTISEERKGFADYLLRCRAAGDIAFDDDPLELASLFVAMAQGEWGLRLATGMTEALTDAMIEEHAQRVTRIFLRGLAPPRRT
jgi:AcrR family transcriptional regulator